MPRSYDDEIISLEVGSGYRNLEDFWVNHERKKIWRTVSPAPSYNTSGVWCLPRQCFNFFFFFKQNKLLGKDFQENTHHMKSEGVDWPLRSR